MRASVANGCFVEFGEYKNNLYGTTYASISEAIRNKLTPIVSLVDYQGVDKIRHVCRVGTVVIRIRRRPARLVQSDVGCVQKADFELSHESTLQTCLEIVNIMRAKE